MILILALLVVSDDGQKLFPPEIPFDRVTDEANGQWITVTLTVNTAEDLLDGKTFYGCLSDNHIARSVCFRKVIDLDERLVHIVSGRLLVIHHPPMITEDGAFEGFIEYRLVDAVQLK